MAGVKIPKHSQPKPHPDVSVWSLVMHFCLLNSIPPRQLPCLAEDPQGEKVMCTSSEKQASGILPPRQARSTQQCVSCVLWPGGKCAMGPHAGKTDPGHPYWLLIFLKLT